MIRKETEIKIASAFKLLRKHGIYCCVPGWYDLNSPHEAVLFAKDAEKFYRENK